jgi:hypothetical protein
VVNATLIDRSPESFSLYSPRKTRRCIVRESLSNSRLSITLRISQMPWTRAKKRLKARRYTRRKAWNVKEDVKEEGKAV